MQKAMEELFSAIQEKLQRAGIEGSFFSTLRNVYEETDNKANYNKKKHFQMKRWILRGSAAASGINIIASVLGAYDGVSQIVPILTGFASIASVLVTLFLGKKESGKYCETWLRHQSHRADMEFEMMSFAYGTEKYKLCNEHEAATQFVENMLRIWKENQDQFEKNMMNFEKD